MASMDVPTDRPGRVSAARRVVARPTYITWLTLAFMTTASVASLRSAPTMAVYGLTCVPAVWRRARMALAIVALAKATLLVLAYRRALGIPQRSCWPPPPGAVTSAGARAATEARVARGGTRPHGAALDFAWSTAATIEPWVEGATSSPASSRTSKPPARPCTS